MAATIERQASDQVGKVEDWARGHAARWCELCDDFKGQSLARMLSREPSEVELQNHRQELKMFLRITRLLYAEIADPDFSDRSLVSDLFVRLRQLEDLWSEIHEAIPDAEADLVLRSVFPNES